MNERLDCKQATGRECNYLKRVSLEVGDDSSLDHGGSNKNMKRWIDLRVLRNQELIGHVLDSAAGNECTISVREVYQLKY